MNLIEKYNDSISNHDFKTCNKVLEDFSREHHTFINQIFGDRTIRGYIRELYPERAARFKFKVKPVEGYLHHFVEGERLVEAKKRPGKREVKSVISQPITEKVKICSVESGHQNWNVNVNDMLCQSYSLLAFFEIPIHNQMQRQIDMVSMYRGIIKEDKFLQNLEYTILNPENSGLWKDYRVDPKNPPDLEMNLSVILDGIRQTLHDWESFGYHYFIGKGTCPGTPEYTPPPPPEPRVTRSRNPQPEPVSEPVSDPVRNVRPRRGERGGKKKSKSRKSKSRK